MCNYQTLYHSENAGYVVQCLECDKIQIGYGNIMLTVNKEGFAAFHWWLKKIRDEQEPCLKDTLRCIAIPTPCEGVKLLLSLRELNEFEHIIESADSELKSFEMMNLFNNSNKM